MTDNTRTDDGDKAVRDRGYADRMAQLHAQFPEDDEAAAQFAERIPALLQRTWDHVGAERVREYLHDAQQRAKRSMKAFSSSGAAATNRRWPTMRATSSIKSSGTTRSRRSNGTVTANASPDCRCGRSSLRSWPAS